jgi:hypothetical protein
MSEWIELEKLHADDERPLAFLLVRLIGPRTEEPHRVLLDSGSDLSVFPTHVLERLGVDFSNGRLLSAATGEGTGDRRIGEPTTISCAFDDYEIEIAAIGSDNADVCIFGLHDFFREFTITFEIAPGLKGRFKLESVERSR